MRAATAIFVLCAAFVFVTACGRKQSRSDVEPEAAAKNESTGTHYALPGLNHGLLQSPINILSGAAEGGSHQIAVNLHGAEPNYLSNTGKTIKLEFPKGATIALDGREYALKQVHFHTPAEHQVDGITYPMELHVVNAIEPKTADEPPRYLVLSFLYRMGEPDPFITSFLEAVPRATGGEELKPGRVHIDDGDGTRFIGDSYHYTGSLTTPPHTETVEWLIQKEIVEASPEQIRRINQLEGDNARHVQALYGRRIDE